MAMLIQSMIAGGPQAMVQAAGRLFGLEIRRSGPSARDDLRLAHFLKSRGIELLFDVGANRGQFASQIFDAGFAGELVSFEAMPHAHAILSATAQASGRRWTVAPMGALSDSEGEVEFNVNNSDATSSLLEASADSLISIPGIRPQLKVKVPTRRLDDVAPSYGVDRRRSFIKIDVQGGEGLVLAGAEATLKQVDGIQIELSLTELYAGQPLFQDVLAHLLPLGFELHDISPAYRDPVSYRLKQVDAVLLRQ
jgi:FkbM family methyltransferase